MLPINAMIILVLGILILVGILALFTGVWKPAAGGTSLETATQTTCLRARAFCDYITYGTKLARVPVFDFDANKNGTINDHRAPTVAAEVGKYVTAAGQDNLEMLCVNFYGCAGHPTTGAWSGGGRKCCAVQVCGCPDIG